MPEVRAMCAIGARGQLGLRGRLPWEGADGPVFVADVARFFATTVGHVLLVGPATLSSIPHFAFTDRTIVGVRTTDMPEAVIAAFPERVIYVGGGPKVWASYAPLIQHWDVTRLPYDGDADRWFDPAWLVAGTAMHEAGGT